MTRTSFLLRELVVRDLRARYSGSALGFLWAFVGPVWQLVLYTLVFSTLLRISLVGERTTSFPTFLFAGLLPWMAFSEGVTRGATSILENAQLVKKMRFPSHVLVLSVVFSAALHAGVAMLLFFAYQAFRGEIVYRHLPGLMVALAVQLALTIGFALVVASLQVYFRDVLHSLGMVLSALFYVTPIVYPMGLVPEGAREWLRANPLTTVVTLFRSFFTGSDPPSLLSIGVLVAVSAALLAAGALVLRRLAGGFADQL